MKMISSKFGIAFLTAFGILVAIGIVLWLIFYLAGLISATDFTEVGNIITNWFNTSVTEMRIGDILIIIVLYRLFFGGK